MPPHTDPFYYPQILTEIHTLLISLTGRIRHFSIILFSSFIAFVDFLTTPQQRASTRRRTGGIFEIGYEKRQLLEIILGVSQKVMGNYVNHLAETPVDKAFQKFA